MVLDSKKQIMYVFGGRIISNDSLNTNYSGLYSWDIKRNKWKLLRSDESGFDGIVVKSRVGHSMLFNENSREIYIFAGQRHKEFLSDFYVYNIDRDIFHELTRDYSKIGGILLIK